MERIKQAIERARAERERNGASSPVSAGIPTPEGEAIQYTRTRVESVTANLLRDRRVVSAFESGPFTESYKILRTQVLQRLRDGGWNTLAITSPGNSEGKTLTAINLAISLASEMTGTVLLVDADLRHPSVHEYFGLNPERGLSDYLMGDAEIADLLVHPEGIKRFVLLPGGRPLTNSAEMLNSPRMSQLVEDLKTRYPTRIVLFDLPPLLTAADALAFSPYVESALLVLEEGATQADDVQRAAELLQKTRLIGTVLNKSHSVANEGDAAGVLKTKLANRLLTSRSLGKIEKKLSGWIAQLRRKKH